MFASGNKVFKSACVGLVPLGVKCACICAGDGEVFTLAVKCVVGALFAMLWCVVCGMWYVVWFVVVVLLFVVEWIIIKK